MRPSTSRKAGPVMGYIFGLNIGLSHPIPGLPAAGANAAVDVAVDLSNQHAPAPNHTNESPWLEITDDTEGENRQLSVQRRASDGRFHFIYADGTEFFIDSAGTRVRALWPDTLTIEDTAVYLLGPIIGFILRLRGIVSLHASAVVVDNRAVAFLAPAGFGKSTVAAAFAARGFPVLTDDITALMEIEDTPWVLPAYPLVRLWPDSVSVLLGSDASLPRLSPNHPSWDKCYLDLSMPPYRFQSEPVPLMAIYTARASNDHTEPEIAPLSPRKALLVLAANSYNASLLDRDPRGNDFTTFGRIASRIPVRCFYGRSQPAMDPFEFQARILRDLEKQ